ncbi:hypothetical protein [Hymenobacter coccineus]|nr:hypothetical protein [Hymenobacter coccineus]
MAATKPKPDWSGIVQQMAADETGLEAAIAGDPQARQQVTFAHPLAVPTK